MIEPKHSFWSFPERVLPYLAFLFLAFFHFSFMLDDPFISFRYAGNLLDGHGLVFNPGERVEGYSNFLWIMLLTPFMKLGFNPVVFSKLLGLLSGVLTIHVTGRLAALIFEDHPQKRLLTFIATSLIGFSWYFSLWSVGGLETGLFAFLVTSSLYLFVKHDHSGAALDWSFVPLAFAGMTRPEAPLFFVALFSVKLFRLARKQQLIWNLAAWATGFAAIFGSYFLWRALYYGELLPNPYYAKTLGGVQQYVLGAGYLWQFFSSQGRAYLVIAALAVCGLPRMIFRSARIFTVGLLFSLYAAFMVYAGGDWMCGFRFFAHIYPIYAILFAAGLLEFVGFSARILRARRYANVISVALFTLLISSSLSSSYRNLNRSAPWLDNWFKSLSIPWAGPYAEIASYMIEYVPKGSWVALGEAGIIPYYAKHIKVIDILGLMDKHIARMPGLLHRKGDADYVLGRNPDYILLLAEEDKNGIIRFAIEPMSQFYRSGRFQEKYRLVRKVLRSNSGALADMFLLYRRIDLPEPSLNLDAFEFKESPDVRVEVNPSELIAGRDTLFLRVANLDASAVDILYTLDGKHMPIAHGWRLDRHHSSQVFVSADTPKGRYVYEAIRESGSPALSGWIRINVPVVIR